MKLETKVKLAKYLPFIRCCNDGNIKLDIAQIIQTVIVALVVGSGASIISTKIAVTAIDSEVKTIQDCIKRIEMSQKEAIDNSNKNFQLIMSNDKELVILRERVNYLDRRIDNKR